MTNESGPQQWPYKTSSLHMGDADAQFKKLRDEYKRAQNRYNARKTEKNQSILAAALKAGFDFLAVKGLNPNPTVGENLALRKAVSRGFVVEISFPAIGNHHGRSFPVLNSGPIQSDRI